MRPSRTQLRTILPPPLTARLRAGRAKLRLVKNHYVLQQSLEDRPAWQNAAAALQVLFKKGKTILFFPERSHFRFAAYECCVFLGYVMTKDPEERFDIAFKRKNDTFCDPAVLDRIPLDRDRIVNAGSMDISKRRVGRVFAEVFTYDLDVDPVRYLGSMVEKSDLNGVHKCRVLQGPLDQADIRSECVYQKEVDNRSDRAGFMLDYRVPVHGGRIPLVYLKYRSEKTRFTEFQHTVFCEPEVLFSREEQERFIEMARKMGVDYGELDVLKDSDGRLYVVDVNNTPMTHIENLPAGRQRREALECMSRSFEQMLESFSKG